MPTHAHVGWGLLISLLLHVSGIAALSLALPRLNVRPGVVRQVEFAVFEAPAETAQSAATAAPPLPAASDMANPSDARAIENAASAPLAAADDTATPSDVQAVENAASAPQVAASAASTTAPATAPPTRLSVRARKPVTQPLTAAASPRQISSATHADPRSDGSALQRVLTQIAATSELTPDERRKAMLVVLRTWEDPSGTHNAEELIDALLKDARKTRAAPQQK